MFILDENGNLIFVPRQFCFADGEDGDGGGGGGGGSGDEGTDSGDEGGEDGGKADKAKADGSGDGGKAGDKGKEQVADWREGLSEDARKFAETSPDVGHLVNRALDMQKKLSGAIVPPGKDAPEEDVAAYRKQIGVPESPEGYTFKMPEGQKATDADKEFHKTMSEAFHKLNITSAQAAGLNAVVNELTTATQKADKKFADESEAALKRDWGKEYDQNKTHADRAADFAFGDQIEEARHLELKDGRFLMDHPVMLRALAAIGREMQEGGLVPPLTGDAAEQAKTQLQDIRDRIAQAQAKGDSKEADRLYQKEQQLIAQTQGNRPVVGSSGRAA